MSIETIQEIERNIKASKEAIEFGNSVTRLQNNKDFKAVILKGYFEEEAVRLVHLKADQNMQSADMQRSIIAQMDAIGTVKQYLSMAMHKASLAGKSLVYDEEILEEIAAEEVSNG